MPIRPENLHRYPKDWPQIRERIRERDGHKCKFCHVGNHWHGYRDGAGVFHCTGYDEVKANVWPPIADLRNNQVEAELRNFKLIEIVCTVAHLDHQPENCSDDNLALLCQRCHLAYDQAHHYATRRKGRAVADLFESSP